jgi:hypothetical protein
VEVGTNTSTVTLRVVGSLKSETVKYGYETKGTRIQEGLRWRGPVAYTKDRPVLPSQRVPHKNNRNCKRVIKIWSYAPYGFFIPGQTGRLTVGRNVRLRLTLMGVKQAKGPN